MRLLVAENDPALGTFLQRGFDDEHYAVDLTSDGESTQALAKEREYDLAILDLNLPHPDGLEVLQQVRARRQQLPILVLTARNRLEDRVRVLDLGADDFLLKPFAFSELSARVRALLRRGGRGPETVFRVDDLELNRVEHTFTRGGRTIDLTPKEFALLEYLMRNAGQRVTRAQIVAHVWNLSFDTMTNVVDVYINYVRKKVDAPCERKLIHTIRGVGYQLQAAARPEPLRLDSFVKEKSGRNRDSIYRREPA
jgi:DNA-binding response OmpR family regulator